MSLAHDIQKLKDELFESSRVKEEKNKVLTLTARELLIAID